MLLRGGGEEMSMLEEIWTCGLTYKSLMATLMS